MRDFTGEPPIPPSEWPIRRNPEFGVGALHAEADPGIGRRGGRDPAPFDRFTQEGCVSGRFDSPETNRRQA